MVVGTKAVLTQPLAMFIWTAECTVLPWSPSHPPHSQNLAESVNDPSLLFPVRGNHSGDRPGSQMSFLDQFLKDTNAHHRSSSQQLHHHQQQQHQQQLHQGLGFDRGAHRASQDSLGVAASAAEAAAANRDSVGSSRCVKSFFNETITGF